MRESFCDLAGKFAALATAWTIRNALMSHPEAKSGFGVPFGVIAGPLSLLRGGWKSAVSANGQNILLADRHCPLLSNTLVINS
jgi:hypothetical protein